MALEKAMPAQAPINVLIAAADDQLIESIRLILAESLRVKAIRVVKTGHECLRQVEDWDPDILLLSEGISEMSALEVCYTVSRSTPRVRTIILTPSDDRDYLYRAMDAGARRVVRILYGEGNRVSLPPGFVGIIEKTAELATGGWKKLLGRIIAIWSAKGGVGRSFIAANLAALLAQGDRNLRVVLVDLNLPFGGLGSMLNIELSHSMYDLLPAINELGSTDIEAVVTERQVGKDATFRVLVAPEHPTQAAEFTSQDVGSILTALQRDHDFVIVDASSAVSDTTLPALEMADEILYVCTPDLPSVAMTKAGLVFLQNSDIPPGKVLIVLNRLSPHAEITAKDLEDNFGDYQIVGRIPSDFRGIQSALNRGLLLAELPNPPRPVVDGLRALADRIGKASVAPFTIEAVRRAR